MNGSSKISTGGSPSSAAAMPSRWRMPREYPPALRRAADCSPAGSPGTGMERLAAQGRWGS